MLDGGVIATFDSSFNLIEQNSQSSDQSNSNVISLNEHPLPSPTHPAISLIQETPVNIDEPSTSGISQKHTSSGNQYARIVSIDEMDINCLLYTSPSPRDKRQSRMPSSA